MQNIQIARIACAAIGVELADKSEQTQLQYAEKVHAIREAETVQTGDPFNDVVLACLAEADALADDYDGNAIEVRNGALAYAIQQHKGEAEPATVVSTAGVFETFLKSGVRDNG